MILRGKGTSRDLACYCEQFWTPPFCQSPTPDPQIPPHRTPPQTIKPRPTVTSLAPPCLGHAHRPRPGCPGLAPHTRAELNPEGPRHTRSPPTPTRPPQAPPPSPWPRRDPAPYGLRCVAAAAASSCVPSLLWLVTRFLHPTACQEQSGLRGSGRGLFTCVRGSWAG